MCLGGGNYTPEYHATNDVWSSEDGVHWKQETAHAPWHERLWFSTVVYRDRLWVIGGWSNNPAANKNDAWYSQSGWREAMRNLLTAKSGRWIFLKHGLRKLRKLRKRLRLSLHLPGRSQNSKLESLQKLSVLVIVSREFTITRGAVVPIQTCWESH